MAITMNVVHITSYCCDYMVKKHNCWPKAKNVLQKVEKIKKEKHSTSLILPWQSDLGFIKRLDCQTEWK